MASLQDPLTINGVVYNEMKGAFSSPESVLDRYTRAVLFPDTPYRNESGGDPARIPELTYEQFIEFHKITTIANSYIYLYGNMDMAEKLAWLDEAYLSKYDRADFTRYVRLSIIDVQLRTSEASIDVQLVRLSIDRCTATVRLSIIDVQLYV